MKIKAQKRHLASQIDNNLKKMFISYRIEENELRIYTDIFAPSAHH